VVVLVPIAVGVPAVVVFVPPAMLLPPATLARFVQDMTLVIGLPAVMSVSVNGMVEFVFGVSDSTLAAVDVFGVEFWHRAEEQKNSGEEGYCCGRKLLRAIHETCLRW
jgi:hypothetical protein